MKEDLRGLVRNPDHGTSVVAGLFQEQRRSKLQERIYQALPWAPDGLTDEELRFLPEFAADGYAESTIRKRRTELYQMGLVVDTGKVRLNSSNMWMTVWGKVPPRRKRRSLLPPPPVAKVRRG